MIALLLLVLLATAATARHTARHYFGQNGSLPRGLINLGTVNVVGFGEVYVVTGNPGNVDKLDNGFRLHGGGGGRSRRLFLARQVIYYINTLIVYLATSNVDIGSDPFMYWQTNLADNVWSYDIDVSNVGCKETCTFIYGRVFLAFRNPLRCRGGRIRTTSCSPGFCRH